MIRRAILGLLALAAAVCAAAHTLDEYLQATVLMVESERITGELRLVPGVEIWPQVASRIDTNGDGRLDDAEVQRYAQSVVHDLSLTVDGTALPISLRSMEMSPLEAFQEGGGEMRLRFEAHRTAPGAPRVLVFQNRHRIGEVAYLANVVKSDDPALAVSSQRRSADQSRFEVHFGNAGTMPPK